MKKILLVLTSFALFGFAQAQFSIQKAVLEEYTGAWCGYCPDGAIILESVMQNNPNVIAIAVHQGDDMQISSGADLVNFWSPGFPQATVNRDGSLYSRGSWGAATSTATQGASSVTVAIDSLTYDNTTRQLDLQVKATFTGPETGDMRFNLVVIEDNVTGTGPGYNQTNYYNTTANHPMQGAGNPIVGYVHSHVLRAHLDGPWGTAGLIPSTVNFGTSVTQNYSYTVPAAWKEEDVHVVAYISRFDGSGQSDRRILNGEEADIYEPAVGIDELNAHSDVMEIAPNPVVDRSKVLFTLREAGNIRMEVINQMGQHVATLGEGFMNEGAHTLYWNGRNDAQGPVANGIYYIRLITEHGQSNATQVLLQR
ncbi:MAG: Omp28-related outer membrane protein [Bacteroidota bacterium]